MAFVLAVFGIGRRTPACDFQNRFSGWEVGAGIHDLQQILILIGYRTMLRHKRFLNAEGKTATSSQSVRYWLSSRLFTNALVLIKQRHREFAG
jgi:hypothetical protein